MKRWRSEFWAKAPAHRTKAPYPPTLLRSIRSSVLMGSTPPVLEIDPHEIIIGIEATVAVDSAPDLQIDHRLFGSVDEVVTIAIAGRKTGAHAGCQPLR